jgi:CheY-like chemotaxis protein
MSGDARIAAEGTRGPIVDAGSAWAYKRPPMSNKAHAKWPRRILVVEDNDDGRESLVEVLRTEGHEVLGAADGKQAALDAQAFKPEVVLLDIGLPGMNGHEVARALRSDPITRSAFIAVVTGYDSAAERQRATDAGVDLYLVKPVSFEGLQLALLMPDWTMPVEES